MREEATMTTRVSVGWTTRSTIWAVVLLSSLACGGRPQEQQAQAASPGASGQSPPPQDGAAQPLQPIPSHEQAMPGQAPAEQALPPGHPPLQGGQPAGDVRWTAPKEWIAVPPSSTMRRAQYRLPAVSGDTEDGECVVYYFGAGQGGDAQSNMQRWVAQFSGKGSESPRTSQVKAGNLTVSRVEVGGTYTPSPMSMMGGPAPQPKAGYMLLGAIVPGPDSNWFFKCTGPEKTMKANRERFDALLGSIEVAR
jgi:hypothetical protein